MDSTTLLIKLAAIAGGIIFIIIGIAQKRKAQKAAETWLAVPGVILSSGVNEHHSRNSKGHTTTTYRPYVSYQYEVMGQPYTGNQIGFGTAGYGHGKAMSIIAAYPQGAPVTVHYDPADPAKAVLETKDVGGGSFVIIGIIFLVVGVLSFLLIP
jgi:hypothetical protein